jgi:hypothetical protein
MVRYRSRLFSTRQDRFFVITVARRAGKCKTEAHAGPQPVVLKAAWT